MMMMMMMMILMMMPRLEEMLAGKDEAVRRRVRIIYADLRADINDQLAKDIGDIQVRGHLHLHLVE